MASLLSQPPTSASPERPLPCSTPSSSLADHVSTKTKQAILRGEYVEFDLLLPENSSLLTDNELTGLSISVGGKQADLPNSRKKKAHVDSFDKWLCAFAVYCTILLTSFPRRAVEMFTYQEIIRSAQRKFAGFAWLSKSAKNLPSAYQHPFLIEENLLKEVELGRLAGPFESPPPPPSQTFRSIPLGWFQKRIAKNGALFSTSLSPNSSPIA